MSKNDGGPSFPSHGSMGEVVQEGMTLRQYYAAKALSIAWDAYDKGYCGMDGKELAPDDLAKHAYQIADAMIAYEEKT